MVWLKVGWSLSIAMLAFWLGEGVAGQSCAVICANSLASEERATGMAICETAGMGILGMAAAMVGALLVTTFGGVNVGGIRPLCFISVAGIRDTLFIIPNYIRN